MLYVLCFILIAGVGLLLYGWWDTNRFDVNSTPWTKQAFEAKKYAFVADYIRVYAVYNYGGIYLDSDVEVIKPFDDVLHLPYFVGSDCGTAASPLQIHFGR